MAHATVLLIQQTIPKNAEVLFFGLRQIFATVNPRQYIRKGGENSYNRLLSFLSPARMSTPVIPIERFLA